MELSILVNQKAIHPVSWYDSLYHWTVLTKANFLRLGSVVMGRGMESGLVMYQGHREFGLFNSMLLEVGETIRWFRRVIDTFVLLTFGQVTVWQEHLVVRMEFLPSPPPLVSSSSRRGCFVFSHSLLNQHSGWPLLLGAHGLRHACCYNLHLRNLLGNLL